VPTGTEGGRLTMHLCKTQKTAGAVYNLFDVGDVLLVPNDVPEDESREDSRASKKDRALFSRFA
jgi:hypothetical protein